MPDLDHLPVTWSETAKLCHRFGELQRDPWCPEISEIHTRLQELHPNTLIDFDDEYGIGVIYYGGIDPDLYHFAFFVVESARHVDHGPVLYWRKNTFGSDRQSNVSHFQRLVGLESDGIVGYETRNEIDRTYEYLRNDRGAPPPRRLVPARGNRREAPPPTWHERLLADDDPLL